MKKIKIAVLYGGNSAEHDVSVASGKTIIETLRQSPDKYEIFDVYIEKDKPLDINTISKVDVVFPALHGKNGEDGAVQGLCQLLGLPVIGCGVLSSALCLDKPFSKMLTADIPGLTQVPYKLIYAGDDLSEFNEFPYFVKPADTGSSIAISRVNSDKELREAVMEAAKYNDRIIIEKEINGREFEVGVIGNKKLTVSCVGEVIPKNEFYDYEAKYTEGLAELVVGVDLPGDVSNRIRALAAEIFKALGCRGMARVDFFYVQETGEVIFNEVNTVPGFTETSLFHRLFDKIGISLPKLIELLIEFALE